MSFRIATQHTGCQFNYQSEVRSTLGSSRLQGDSQFVSMIFPLFFLLSKYWCASLACDRGKVLSTIGLKLPFANRGTANLANSCTSFALNCDGLARRVLPMMLSLLLMSCKVRKRSYNTECRSACSPEVQTANDNSQ